MIQLFGWCFLITWIVCGLYVRRTEREDLTTCVLAGFLLTGCVVAFLSLAVFAYLILSGALDAP